MLVIHALLPLATGKANIIAGNYLLGLSLHGNARDAQGQGLLRTSKNKALRCSLPYLQVGPRVSQSDEDILGLPAPMESSQMLKWAIHAAL